MAAEVRPAAISQYSPLKAWRYFGFLPQGREMEMRLQRSQSFATSLSLLGIDLVSTQDGTRDQPLREAFQTFCLMACSKHRCYKSVLFFELPKIVRHIFRWTKFLSQRYCRPWLCLQAHSAEKGSLFCTMPLAPLLKKCSQRKSCILQPISTPMWEPFLFL